MSNKNIKNIVKRLLYILFVLIGLSVLIFILARIMPGDPVRMALGARAPESVIQETIKEHHLDKPIYIQYYYWFKDVLHGNFGRSWVTRGPVIEDIRRFAPATLELIFYTALVSAIFGLLFGTIAGYNSNTWKDNILRVQAYIGTSTPEFVWAIVLMWIFGGIFKILPVMGRLSEGIIPPPSITNFYTIDALIAGDFPVFVDAIKHLIIPVISLSMKAIAETARVIRSNIVANIEKDYITSVKSYGIPIRLILYKYLLKPSIIPATSVFALRVVQFLATAFIVESVFNWPGLSRYGMNALLNKDLNAIVAVVLLTGLLFVIANTIADLIISRLDPRISLMGGEH